jgi:LexA-binding, inner membrane-associated putative hydrolase
VFAIDHAATALILKKKYPRTPMLWLLLSVQLMELLWVAFNYLGIERTTTGPIVESVSDIQLAYMPFSHSILSGLLLAALGYAAVRALSENHAAAMAVGAGILSHLILDLLTHAPDIAIAPGVNEPKFGLGLYANAPLIAFAVEMAYGVLCWWIYRGGKALLAVIVLFNLGNLSLLSRKIPGPEGLFAGHPAMVVTVIAFQIAVTLSLVGSFSKNSHSERSHEFAA